MHLACVFSVFSLYIWTFWGSALLWSVRRAYLFTDLKDELMGFRSFVRQTASFLAKEKSPYLLQGDFKD